MEESQSPITLLDENFNEIEFCWSKNYEVLEQWRNEESMCIIKMVKEVNNEN